MPGAFVLSYNSLRKQKIRKLNIQRRQLRDASNPMSCTDERFVELYRVNKEAFVMILDSIAPHLIQDGSIPKKIQLAATLRFLALASFQSGLANETEISVGRSTISKVLWKTMDALEIALCPIWINLELNDEEMKESKLHFFMKFGLPGVIGCIDGSHVRLIKPRIDESLFYNRKGYFSINVMIICDFKIKIRAVDACRPGLTHDSFVWRMSEARQFIKEKYDNGEKNSWLLGDSGYPAEPFLLTPYRNPQYGTKEHLFNRKHCSGRNIVERTIGNLKSRFRSLQCITLHYTPQKVVKIVNVCSALHNICKSYNMEMVDDLVEYDHDNNEYSGENVNVEEQLSSNEGIRIRDAIADSLFI